MIGDVPPRPARLAEANVEGRASAADEREGAVEDDPIALVLIESQVDKRPHVSAALGGAREDGENAPMPLLLLLLVASILPVRPATVVVFDPQRIRGAGVIMARVFEERRHAGSTHSYRNGL